MLFYLYWCDNVIFIFPFVYEMYCIYWFVNIVPSLHPLDESYLIMVYDIFHVLLDVVCQYFLVSMRILVSMVHQWYWPIVFFLYLGPLFVLMSLAKGVSILFIIWNNQLLDLLILRIVLLDSIAFNSSLIFIICFLLLGLGLLFFHKFLYM